MVSDHALHRLLGHICLHIKGKHGILNFYFHILYPIWKDWFSLLLPQLFKLKFYWHHGCPRLPRGLPQSQLRNDKKSDWCKCQSLLTGKIGWSLIYSNPSSNYRIWPNYRTYPYKRTVKKFRSLQITTSVLFSLLLYRGICCGYPFELHRQVDAIQMSTHNICLCKESQKKSHSHH